jgi:hypothetical protein
MNVTRRMDEEQRVYYEGEGRAIENLGNHITP